MLAVVGQIICPWGKRGHTNVPYPSGPVVIVAHYSMRDSKASLDEMVFVGSFGSALFKEEEHDLLEARGWTGGRLLH